MLAEIYRRGFFHAQFAFIRKPTRNPIPTITRQPAIIISTSFLAAKNWLDVLRKTKTFKDKILYEALVIYGKILAKSYVKRLEALEKINDYVKKLQNRPDVKKIDDVVDYLEELSDEIKKLMPALEKAADEALTIPPDGHANRNSFVRAGVKENEITTRIINQIYKYFPKKSLVISGYLTPSDLYWKVNYHWDAMRTWLEYAKDNDQMDEEEQETLEDIYKRLMSNQPSKLGHYKVDKIGEPEDSSSESKIEERCMLIIKLKAELADYSKEHKFADKKMQLQPLLKYSLNPIALPSKGNHVHGWALDIDGDLNEVADIAEKLGATRAFKEYTHCHCEFKKGVRLPKE